MITWNLLTAFTLMICSLTSICLKKDITNTILAIHIFFSGVFTLLLSLSDIYLKFLALCLIIIFEIQALFALIFYYIYYCTKKRNKLLISNEDK